MLRLALGLSLLLFACGGDDAQGQLDGGNGTGSDATSGDAGASDSDAGAEACLAHALPREIEFEHNGITRTVLLAGPTDLPSNPLPLVINFHGYSDGPELQETYSGMSEDAVEEGYIVAYPRGTGLVKGWNAGACCGTAASNGEDDVGFTTALIDEIAAVACMDRSRVYATGYSNGGFLSHRLACELSETIAGIAPVSGVIGVDECNPARAIPILHMHGTADVTVPYAGSLVLGFPSVDDTMEAWRVRRSCSDSAPTVFYEQGDTTCVRWDGCDAPLGLCTISGGGHTWPGGEVPIFRGATTTDLDANGMMWEFFGQP